MIFRFLGQTRREPFLYYIFSFDGHNGIVNIVERAKLVLVFVVALMAGIYNAISFFDF